MSSLHARKQVQGDQEAWPTVSEFRSQALPVRPAPCGHPQAWLGQHASHPPPGMGPREGCRGGLGVTAPVSPCVWTRTTQPLPPPPAHPTNQLSSLLTFRPVVKLSASTKGPLGV